jgi:hypothetical protein
VPKKVSSRYIHTSSAHVVQKSVDNCYEFLDKKPEVGDVVFGKISHLGLTQQLENCQGRMHNVVVGSKAIFVFGNRYAPDYYEAFVPEKVQTEVDLLSSGGVIGNVVAKNSQTSDPTKVRIIGYALDKDGSVINTTKMSMIKPNRKDLKFPRAKLTLVVGTSMNSGKSYTAASCCWALASMGYDVRAAKITGTARLRDVLRMEDAGATHVADFTHFGYPSTYMLDEDTLLKIFNDADLKHANNPKNHWVVELADGILQRETAILLQSDVVQRRIHRLVFAAGDAFGAIAGMQILKDRYGLTPDAISGVVSSSPLGVREMQQYLSIPVFDNMSWDLKQIADIIL